MPLRRAAFIASPSALRRLPNKYASDLLECADGGAAVLPGWAGRS
jgi:hypothetical protein